MLSVAFHGETSKAGTKESCREFNFVMVCSYNGATRAMPEANVFFGFVSESVLKTKYATEARAGYEASDKTLEDFSGAGAPK